MNYIEKYIDLQEVGAEHTINSYIANGWYIHDNGMTTVILRKTLYIEIL